MLDDLTDAESADEASTIIPLQADGQRVYLSVRRLDAAGDEEEISARIPSFEDVVQKVTTLAAGAVDGLRRTGASRVLLEFGCEIGIEAGQFVAIIGKASGKSTFKIGLEWSADTDGH